MISGFGRLGYPFAAERYGVVPDMITFAKGITNGAVPMSGVMVRKGVYETHMSGPEYLVELFHGYTYSGHPLASAAAIATLDLYQEEGLFDRARSLEEAWANAVHAMKGTRHVIDCRNFGLIGGIELEPRPGAPTKRAMEIFHRAFDEGLLIRVTGDIIALSPPLIISPQQIDEIFEKLTRIIATVD